MASFSNTRTKIQEILSSFMHEKQEFLNKRFTKDVDENPGNASMLCQPWNRDSFYERVATFSWPMKPPDLSPQHCALYGWENMDIDLLRCVSCKATLDGMLGMDWDNESYHTCCARLRSLIVNGHSEYCPWQEIPCPDTFLCLPTRTSQEWKALFERTCKNLLSLDRNLPVLKYDSLLEMELTEDVMEVLVAFTSPSSLNKDIVNTACVLALCGWNMSDEHPGLICCSSCHRQAGLWNFYTIDNPRGIEGDQGTGEENGNETICSEQNIVEETECCQGTCEGVTCEDEITENGTGSVNVAEPAYDMVTDIVPPSDDVLMDSKEHSEAAEEDEEGSIKDALECGFTRVVDPPTKGDGNGIGTTEERNVLFGGNEESSASDDISQNVETSPDHGRQLVEISEMSPLKKDTLEHSDTQSSDDTGSEEYFLEEKSTSDAGVQLPEIGSTAEQVSLTENESVPEDVRTSEKMSASEKVSISAEISICAEDSQSDEISTRDKVSTSQETSACESYTPSEEKPTQISAEISVIQEEHVAEEASMTEHDDAPGEKPISEVEPVVVKMPLSVEEPMLVEHSKSWGEVRMSEEEPLSECRVTEEVPSSANVCISEKELLPGESSATEEAPMSEEYNASLEYGALEKNSIPDELPTSRVISLAGDPPVPDEDEGAAVDVPEEITVCDEDILQHESTSEDVHSMEEKTTSEKHILEEESSLVELPPGENVTTAEVEPSPGEESRQPTDSISPVMVHPPDDNLSHSDPPDSMTDERPVQMSEDVVEERTTPSVPAFVPSALNRGVILSPTYDRQGSLTVEIGEESMSERMRSIQPDLMNGGEGEAEIDTSYPASDRSDDDVLEPSSKRFKFENIEKTEFDPVAEHRNWCPWVQAVPATGNSSQYVQESPGWRILLRHLIQHDSPEKQTPRLNTPPSHVWKSMRRLFLDSALQKRFKRKGKK